MKPTFEEFAKAFKDSGHVMTEGQRQTIRSYIEPLCESVADDMERLQADEPISGVGVEFVERFMNEYPEYKIMVAAAFVGMLLQISDHR